MIAASWKTPSGPSGEAHTVSKPSAVRERSGAFDWPAHLPKTLLAPVRSGWGPLCCCAWNASPGLRVEGHLVRFLVSGKDSTPTISEELRKQRFCPTRDPAPTYSRQARLRTSSSPGVLCTAGVLGEGWRVPHSCPHSPEKGQHEGRHLHPQITELPQSSLNACSYIPRLPLGMSLLSL